MERLEKTLDLFAKIGPQGRVLIITDTRQHQDVDAGKPFEQMQDAGMRISRLETAVRQKDQPYPHSTWVRVPARVVGADRGLDLCIFVGDHDLGTFCCGAGRICDAS